MRFIYEGDLPPGIKIPDRLVCIGCQQLKPGMVGGWCKECCDALAEQGREEAAKAVAACTLANIPKVLQWASFDAPELPRRVNSEAIRRTMALAGKIGSSCKSLVFMGSAGTGKSSLACSLLRELSAERRHVGMCLSTFDIAKARREQRLGRGEAEVIETACTIGLLVIDELAAEQSRDTGVDEVIRARFNNEMTTIYTCGFTQEYVLQKYGDGVARRIFEGATVIALGGA